MVSPVVQGRSCYLLGICFIWQSGIYVDLGILIPKRGKPQLLSGFFLLHSYSLVTENCGDAGLL